MKIKKIKKEMKLLLNSGGKSVVSRKKQKFDQERNWKSHMAHN